MQLDESSFQTCLDHIRRRARRRREDSRLARRSLLLVLVLDLLKPSFYIGLRYVETAGDC